MDWIRLIFIAALFTSGLTTNSDKDDQMVQGTKVDERLLLPGLWKLAGTPDEKRNQLNRAEIFSLLPLPIKIQLLQKHLSAYNKRTPTNDPFLAMRGKKNYGSHEKVAMDLKNLLVKLNDDDPAAASVLRGKKIPDRFLGMRGKKNDPTLANDQLNRPPSKFLGMRGKKIVFWTGDDDVVEEQQSQQYDSEEDSEEFDSHKPSDK